VRRVLTYVHASSSRECFAYLFFAFIFTWAVWIPVLIASRRHEQLSDLLSIGTFGPSVTAILLSYKCVRVPSSKLSSRLVWFSLTLLLCWAVLVGHVILWDQLHLSFGANLLLLLPSAIPAWIVSTAFSRDGGVRTAMRTLVVPRPFFWHAVALFLFPMLLLFTATATRIQGGAVHQPKVGGSGLSYVLLVVVEFGYAFFVGGGVSEEPGWRGFLLPRLQDRFSPLVASLLVWLPWALWHAPLDFGGYAGSTHVAYLRTRVFVLLPLCIVITWVYNRCGRTILSAALFHSAFNVAPDFIPSTELAVWMISVLALSVVVADKMWKRRDGR
jgi:membrane protease YdiL (CAAX protease family)